MNFNAYRLSQKGYSVLIIEGGGKSIGVLGGVDYVGTKGTIDPNTNKPLTKYDVPFYFQSADITGNRWDIEGTNVAKMIGGSGLHNAMVYQRGIESDYNWGLTGWNYQDMLPYFLKVETILDADLQTSNNHGHTGFIKVKSIPFDKEGNDYIKSCNASGLPFNGDFQTGPRAGCGYFHLNIDENGERCSTAHQYLVKALQNPRVKLLDSATVVRIKWIFNIITGKSEAIGIEYFTNDQPNTIKTLFCNKEVILAAGTLNTPKILMHSGIGDANLLAQTKYSNFITPVKHLPGVGKNLQNHFIVFNVWSYSDAGSRPDYYNTFNINLEYSTLGTGILATPGFSVGAWLKPNASAVNADSIMTIFPGALGSTLPGMMTFAISLCEPTPNSNNFLTLNDNTSGNAAQFYSRGAKVSFTPTLENKDVKKLVASLKESRRIMAFPPMSNLATPVQPGPQIDTDQEIEDYVSQNIVPHDHWVGTCKIGDPASDPNAVVDVNLRVIGVNKVRVVDASLFPIIPHGLVQASVMALAEKAAATILKDY
ncbi:hypothetical protein DICPUDRAFT_87019 [Dictyostelium purpureum]|uniref:Glucose-methanol-choline oxidoreductase N-terminal domain-containing protein n=1 Tax=Dictyostelium purpureum TaxID=5786 RepID=F0ZFF5_DICPU|nr:uncharacterized protein DICPUDRAFT_87019 [Dictyostelium purpureum]EGC37327.1 hypothetical protein DICPUDRAFT_87019 [Dictyostelium purpureum]|eukprot:XP_003286141.1 hypothetical protein DICPUDRAFT_87019 [Dictyostelium purpureum]